MRCNGGDEYERLDPKTCRSLHQKPHREMRWGVVEASGRFYKKQWNQAYASREIEKGKA